MPHDCYDKEKEIRKKTGIYLGLDTHDIITAMCINLGFTNSNEMMDWIHTTSAEEIKNQIEKAKLSIRFAMKKQKRMMEAYA